MNRQATPRRGRDGSVQGACRAVRVAFVLALALATACERPAAKEGAGSADAGPLSGPAPATASAATRWVRVRAATQAGLLEAQARVLAAPQASAAVSPPLIARVQRVRVRAGQRVAAGDALVDVVMPELVQAAGAFSAALIRQEAATARRTQLEALRAEGLVRAVELADVAAQLASARADAQAARATLRAAGISDKNAEALLTGDGVVALRAPMDGLIVAVDAVPGETREPAGRPFVELAGEGEGQVEARLQGELAADAAVEFVGADGRRVPLALVALSPRVEARDGARLGWFRATEGRLTVGATGRLRILAQPGWGAVPRRAVLGAGGAGVSAPTRVYVRKGFEAIPRDVRLVASSGAEAVVEGVDEREEVAADAAEVRP